MGCLRESDYGSHGGLPPQPPIIRPESRCYLALGVRRGACSHVGLGIVDDRNLASRPKLRNTGSTVYWAKQDALQPLEYRVDLGSPPFMVQVGLAAFQRNVQGSMLQHLDHEGRLSYRAISPNSLHTAVGHRPL